MNRPALSVIIPTAGRPVWLPRAVRSALELFPNGGCEVIVVPNGPDRSWVQSLAEFKANGCVRISPIRVSNANAARNHGLVIANGELVRFLDDDDYFFVTESRAQCLELLKVSGDVSSGQVMVVNEGGKTIRLLRQPAFADFASGALSPYRLPQPGAHVFRRNAIKGLLWDEDCDVGQDTNWLIQLAGARDLRWQKYNSPVAVWVHHRQTRVYRGRDPGNESLQRVVRSIDTAVDRLSKRGVLTGEQLRAASDGLWALFQKGFRYDVRYWYQVAKTAEGYCSGRRPPSRIYRMPFLRRLSPVILEIMLIPVRTAYHHLRLILKRLRPDFD